MENPFKKIIPDQEAPEKEIQAKVMSSVHLKSHFSAILEFFMVILGVRTEEPEKQDLKTEGNQSKDPGHFY